jgi:hypothetical protein
MRASSSAVSAARAGFSEPHEPVEHLEEGVLEVLEALGGEDEVGDLGWEWMLVDHLGQALDLALRRWLEPHHQPAEWSRRQQTDRERRGGVEHDGRNPMCAKAVVRSGLSMASELDHCKPSELATTTGRSRPDPSSTSVRRRTLPRRCPRR